MRRILFWTLPLALTIACSPPPPASPEDGKQPAQPETPPATQAAADAPAEALPEAKTVLSRAVEAVGGKSKVDAVQSYYSESKLEIPAQNLSATTKIWWQGGKFYMETDMPGVGLTTSWNNAEGAWSEDPINGRRKLEGAEARQAAWGNSVFLPAHWEQFFATAETVGRRTEGDKKILDVLLRSKEGDELTLSFDEANGLLVGQSYKQDTPMGSMPVQITVEDYGDFGGLKTPVKQVMSMAVITATTTVTKFEPNAKVDPKMFEPKTKPADAKPKAAAAAKSAGKTTKK